MRKLNKKNKTTIAFLSALVAIVFIAIILFIVYKVRIMNIKYDISAPAVTFNTNEELVNIKDDTYAKKNLFGSYYIMDNKDKIAVGSNPVIYNTSSRTIKLLGTFYEILAAGEVNKLKDETDISDTVNSRIFKIDDRKYLIIGESITSEDGSLNTKDYLLINIDKAGNGYLYNNEIHLKSFNDLVIKTGDIIFKVNSEKLIMGNEEIDLSKINGSTNEYKETENKSTETDTSEETETEDVYTTSTSSIYKQNSTTVIKDEVIQTKVEENQYLLRKTSVLNVDATSNKIKINYVVYDPLNEIKSVYFNLYADGALINKYDLDISASTYEINNLIANKEYTLEFHYTYIDDESITQDTIFDSVSKTTNNVKSTITLEKVTNNSVSYILKIDSDALIDSAQVGLYIDDVLQSDSIETVNISEAKSSGGFKGSITYTGTGSVAMLKLINCTYSGEPLEIDSSYKYKM